MFPKNALSIIVKEPDGGVNPVSVDDCAKLTSGDGLMPNVSSKLSESEGVEELFVSCGVLAFARLLLSVARLPLLLLLLVMRVKDDSFTGDCVVEDDVLEVGRTPVMFTSLEDFGWKDVVFALVLVLANGCWKVKLN